MTRLPARAPRSAAGLLALLVAGCATVLAPRPDATRFFMLNAVDTTDARDPAAGRTADAQLVIGLGPVSFPQYLARSELVTRTAANQLQLSSNDRWAESLDVAFRRVLALDLARALGGAQVASFPWFGVAPHPVYRVEPSIDRFDADADGAVHLTARWTILEGSTGRLLYSSASDLAENAPAGDHAAMAAALSTATGQFADAIAAAIKRLRDRPVSG